MLCYGSIVIPKVEVDISVALKVTANVLRKLPFAINNALTRTAREMLEKGKVEIAAHLTVRKSGKSSIVNRLQILKFSKTSDLTVIVGINANVQGAPILLGFLEEGGQKQPDNGPGIAVPLTGSPARPSFSASVVRALQYTKLNLQLAQTGDRIEGLQQTYEVPGVGIFKRVAPGSGPDATVMIYKFESTVPLPKKLSLLEVMKTVAQERFDPIFYEEFEKEITRQKPTR